jgi:glutamine synthetase
VIPAPKNLETAINYFRNSESAEELLGKEIRDHYANLFSIESNMYNRVITDFEFKRYFDHS